MDCVLGRAQGGVVEVGITGEAPDRDICQGYGQRMFAGLIVGHHVTVDIATAEHLETQ